MLDSLLDEIADRVADRLLARLDRSSSTSVVVYSTHKHGPHLPGKSRRWMLEHVRKMPGARKVGRDWVIAPADYEAWVRAEDSRRVALASKPKLPAVGATKEAPTVSNDITPESDEAELQRRIARSLQAQGLRRSR